MSGSSAPPRALPEMCFMCFDELLQRLKGFRMAIEASESWKDGIRDCTCPLFITWNIQRGHQVVLRGCIGTLAPTKLITGLSRYALTSAFEDQRFAPVQLSEVPHLQCSVSLLVQYENCRDCFDWDLNIHGIIIQWNEDAPSCRSYSATYLPHVAKEQGWNHHQTIASLVAKAGYQGPVSEALVKRIKCQRYQSSKCQVTFAEYCKARGIVDPSHLEKAETSCCLM